MEVLIAVLLVALGAFCIFYYRPKMLSKVTEVKFMQTKNIAELKAMFDQMKEMSLDSDYREYVEIKAAAVTECPMKTPYSERNVAFCDSKLIQVSETREQYRDKEGCIRTRTSKHETTISDEKTSQSIEVKDSSCPDRVEVEINANGCELDIPKTFDRFEPKTNLNRYNYFSRFSFDRFGSETLGFKMVEKTIDLNQSLYIIGEAYRVGDILHIGKPRDSKKPFIVSTKSEEELVNTTDKNAKLALFGGIALIAMGIIVAAVMILK